MKAGITPFVVFYGSPLPAMANDDDILGEGEKISMSTIYNF